MVCKCGNIKKYSFVILWLSAVSFFMLLPQRNISLSFGCLEKDKILDLEDLDCVIVNLYNKTVHNSSNNFFHLWSPKCMTIGKMLLWKCPINYTDIPLQTTVFQLPLNEKIAKWKTACSLCWTEKKRNHVLMFVTVLKKSNWSSASAYSLLSY